MVGISSACICHESSLPFKLHTLKVTDYLTLVLFQLVFPKRPISQSPQSVSNVIGSQELCSRDLVTSLFLKFNRWQMNTFCLWK